jgi:hypothetical protein
MITVNLGVDDLGDDVSVGETNNKSVLWRVVLVLGLNNKTLSGVVISLSFYRPKS